MKIHYFIVPDINLSQKTIKLSGKDYLHQIKEVLRLRVGEKIFITDGQGEKALVKLEKINNTGIELSVLENISEKTNRLKVHLFQSITKKNTFETQVGKATECGVFGITPILSERTVKLGLNEDRLLKIIKESAEVSERSFLPRFNKETPFLEALKDAPGKKIIFDRSGDSLSKNLKEIQTFNEISIFIGPEGGFTEKEIAEAKENDFLIISLGENILKSETATTIAVYNIAHILDLS